MVPFSFPTSYSVTRKKQNRNFLIASTFPLNFYLRLIGLQVKHELGFEKKSPNVSEHTLSKKKNSFRWCKMGTLIMICSTLLETHTSVSFPFSPSPGCSLAVRMPKSNFPVIATSTQQNSLTHRVKCVNANYIYNLLANCSLINTPLTQ